MKRLLIIISIALFTASWPFATNWGLFYKTTAFAEKISRGHDIKGHPKTGPSHKSGGTATSLRFHTPSRVSVRVSSHKKGHSSHSVTKHSTRPTKAHGPSSHKTITTKTHRSVHTTHTTVKPRVKRVPKFVHTPKSIKRLKAHKTHGVLPHHPEPCATTTTRLSPNREGKDVDDGTSQLSGQDSVIQDEEEEEKKEDGPASHLADRKWQHEPLVLLAVDMAPQLAEEAKRAGFEIIQFITLKNLGITIAKIKAESPEQERKIRRWFRKRGVEFVIYNDFYVLNQGSALYEFQENYPWSMLGWPYPCSGCGRGLKIGMVDTSVDTSIPVLSSRKIFQKMFVRAPSSEEYFEHGTSIAAILVGNCEGEFCGLLPEARLFVAATFEPLEENSPRATALSIAKGLDWLLGHGVQVVNLSFCGPNNPLLHRAISNTLKNGIPVVAAAGNYGEKAPSIYPAAYKGVIAVTAIDKFGHPYPGANRGSYISFSDPGVRVPVPNANGKISFRSGTSYATAYCTALVAIMAEKGRNIKSVNNVIERIKRDVIDLGPAGKDEVFGWGLARCGEECKAHLK